MEFSERNLLVSCLLRCSMHEAFENKLSTIVAGRSIELEETKNENGEPAIRLNIINSEGVRTETFIDDEISWKGSENQRL